ncbi:PadR family transcriptional regulator [Mycobacterium sp. Y57]|uniref:PadR family transcriptional regulator n=1 Tax=Mycolicibacterium xanthum TaxID=2796469 RepID=UPI001C84BE2F|nr:PadR family transcriptional regulator [Mycolicibacterium xanthum]MBX7433897.1 PadR family transcriptional regulator [Mycolicibacterium xanthum]
MTKPFNATSAALLGFLHAGPMSGWDLMQTADATIGAYWTITRSQIYRELAVLEREGFVESGDAGRRERRPYTITQRGRESFCEWVNTSPPLEQIRFPLLLTIAFGEHVEPRNLAEFVTAHKQLHQNRLHDYRQRVEELGDTAVPFSRATLDFGIRYEQAILEWFQELPNILDLPTHDGVGE